MPLSRLLLRWLARRAPTPPDFGRLPPEPSDSSPEWLMERIGPGVARHFPPPATRVERGGPAVDPTAPLPQPAPQRVRPGRLFSANGSSRDGTRTP
jgi:hypothetical protein